jgi:transcriptional regulator with XRE-family HTH domain
MQHLPPILQEMKTTRIAKKLSQEDLARAAGIPRRTYQRLERDDPGIRIDTFFRVLTALGLTLKATSRTRPALEELGDLYGNDA